MDLQEVIAELRSELETLDRVVESLERLAQIRTESLMGGAAEAPEAPAAKRRFRESPEMAKTASSSS